MTFEKGVSVVYDGEVFIPDHPMNLRVGKKYHITIQDIPPDNRVQDRKPEDMHISETASLSEYVLAREWLTSEEDEAWDYL